MGRQVPGTFDFTIDLVDLRTDLTPMRIFTPAGWVDSLSVAGDQVLVDETLLSCAF